MLIRFEKYSLYFLQQLGKAILCWLLPWGSLRKQYENDFFSFFFLLHNKHIWRSQANAEIKAKLKPFFFSRPCAKMPILFLFHFFTIVSAYFLLNPISLCDWEYEDVRRLLRRWTGCTPDDADRHKRYRGRTYTKMRWPWDSRHRQVAAVCLWHLRVEWETAEW